MKVNCTQHRKTMELLSLKMKLEKETVEQKELKRLKKRIQELEEELDMD